MIDHVSVVVSDLEKSASFYEEVLATIGYSRLIEKVGTVGFGKSYPEFWINFRSKHTASQSFNGAHVCLRCLETESVDNFYETARRLGAGDQGGPGLRPHYSPHYYAAFIRDPDGNTIEAVTFVEIPSEKNPTARKPRGS